MKSQHSGKEAFMALYLGKPSKLNRGETLDQVQLCGGGGVFGNKEKVLTSRGFQRLKNNDPFHPMSTRKTYDFINCCTNHGQYFSYSPCFEQFLVVILLKKSHRLI